MINKTVAAVRGMVKDPDFESKHPRRRGKFTEKVKVAEPTKSFTFGDEIKRIISEMTNILNREGVSPKELNRHLKNITRGSKTVIARPYASLAGLLKYGRLSTLFDAPDEILDELPAATDKRIRRDLEFQTAGVPQNAPNSARTVYGSLMKEADYSSNIMNYGDVQIILKPSVDDRTTITVGDSLNGYLNRDSEADAFFPSPKKDPQYYSVAPSRAKESLEANSLIDLSLMSEHEYVEAQIHGGVRLEDVAEIHSYSNDITDWDILVEKFKQRGIKLIDATEEFHR